MAEEKKAKSFEELIKQVEDFESTIKSLGENVGKLKAKLADNKTKYGPDLTKWPKE